jgi:hypothetical protein
MNLIESLLLLAASVALLIFGRGRNGQSVCFFDAKNVGQTNDGHIRVWAFCRVAPSVLFKARAIVAARVLLFASFFNVPLNGVIAFLRALTVALGRFSSPIEIIRQIWVRSAKHTIKDSSNWSLTCGSCSVRKDLRSRLMV